MLIGDSSKLKLGIPLKNRTKRLNFAFSLALAGSVATSAYFVARPNVALAGPGACTTTGTTVTCTGDQSAGITNTGGTPDFTAPPVDTLNVNNLTTAITPANNVDGIEFDVPGGNNITINSDTGPFGITTTGSGDGIYADVDGDGNIAITNTGNISAGQDGIDGNIGLQGNLTISQTGNINSSNGYGIFSYIGGNGPGLAPISINVTSVGNINAASRGGIIAEIEAADGNITVTSTGDIVAGGAGISAYVEEYNGDVTVTSTGNITSVDEAIFAQTEGIGNVVVSNTGNLNSSGREGIVADADDGGNVTVNSTGNVESFRNGINAEIGAAGGNMSVTNNGNITTTNFNGRGIYGVGGNGTNIDISNTGNITTLSNVGYNNTGVTLGGDASAEGIYSFVQGSGNIDITNSGNIAVLNNAPTIFGTLLGDAGAEGIFAGVQANGNITTNNTGNISTAGRTITGTIGAGYDTTSEGIFNQVLGNGNVTINSIGNISAPDNGIAGAVGGNGNIAISTVGNITTTSSTGRGINTFVNGNGNVVINSTGNITSAGSHGIYSDVQADGSIAIQNTGDVSAGEIGIYGYVHGDGTLNVSSSGNITSNDEGLKAYLSGNGSIVVTNTGDITSATEEGIYAYLDENGEVTVINSGNITSFQEAIYAGIEDNGNVTVVNSGNLSSANGQGIATEIDDGEGNISITNSGNITAGTDGIYAYIETGTNSAITISNSGNITAVGLGIDVDHEGSGTISVANTGSISGDTGVFIDNDRNIAPATVSNSGAITGTGGIAIDFRGNGNDTLNLLGGTVIVGSIDFGNGNDGMGGTNANDIDTLNVGPGVNAVLNFADAGGPGQGDDPLQSAPENINASAGALANGGTTFVAVDTARFAADAMSVGSLTRSIFNQLDNAGSGPDSGSSSHGEGSTGAVAFGTTPRFWGSVFGGREVTDGSTTLAGLNNSFGGVSTGVESGFDHGTFGILGGWAQNDISNEFNTSSLDVEWLFGGVYWKQTYDMAQLNVALIGGVSNHDSSRVVGTDIARGDYNGWFISPSATLSMPIESARFQTPFIASARVSYAGLFLDGYTETGSGAPLTIADREVHLFNTRLQLMAPFYYSNDNGSHTHVELRGGIDAQFDGGSSDVSAVALGTPFQFSAELDKQVAGFIGASVTHTFADDRFSLTASTELQSGFDGDVSAYGQLKASLRF